MNVMKRRLAKLIMSQWRIMLSLVCVITLIVPEFVPRVFPSLHPQTAHAAATQNAIQIENSKPGDPTWNDFSTVLQDDAISGYGSKISVNHGETLDLYVTTTAPKVSIDIYRTGWYGGIGARKITSLGSFPGVHQTMPTPNSVTGIISCNWAKTTSLTIPPDWVTGVYLAKLTASTGNQSFIFFVVRNDGGHEGLVFQTSVTTYQAYNTWGGTSLYNNNTNHAVFSGPHATKVSFDRPFNPGDSNGAGHYFFYEYKFVRWMESQGYDVTYTTDVDTHTNVNPLTNHKAFLSVGHDEYWSKGMRDNVQNAIKAGVNVAFFSGNSVYWQIRFEANAAGVPNRVEVGYKDFATDTTPPGPDPMWKVNNSLVTTYWRDPVVNQPENGLMGVMYEQQVDQSYPFVVQNASNWVYAGTGFTNGSQVPGVVGYEYDRTYNNGFTPPNLTVLGSSPLTACCGTGSSHADTTMYTAASGARVFAAGTIQWSWGLDNSQSNTYANPGLQKMTANILDNFTSGALPGVNLSPGNLDFGNTNTGTASTAQTLKLTNNSASPTKISNIAIAGANASDFSQTNNCPQSPGTLAVNTSCNINVTYSPTTNGNSSATVTVTDDSTNSPQSAPVTGTGVTAAPGINLNPTSLNFGGQNVNTTSAARTVALTNNGTLPLTISSIALTGANAGDYIQSNNCPASSGTLAVNASCTLTVSFAPTANGTSNASVTITDNAASSPHTVALTGSGVIPTIYFNDTFEGGDFSKWNMNSNDSTGARAVQGTVVNTGTKAASFTNTSGQYSYLYTGLASAQSLTFTRFYFRVKSGNGGTQLAIARNGNGTNVWEVDYNANRHGLDIYFWNGARTLFAIYTPQNAIAVDTWYSLELQMNEATGGHAEVWLNGTSIGTVDNDLSISQPFQRLMLFNEAVGTLYFDDIAISSTYNGQIAMAPNVNLNPSSLGFGNQGTNTTSATKTVTLTNNGAAPLTISGIALTGTNTRDFNQSNTCPASLAANASCTVSVTFTPTATGSRSASVSITDNATGSPHNIALSGTGITAAPAVTLSPTSQDFGNQSVNTTSGTKTITLANSGSAALTINTIAVNGTNAGDFSQSNNCPTSLAVNATCNITVTFNPSANGGRNATLAITDNAGDSPQGVALSGAGVTPAPAVALNPTSANFGTQNVSTTSGAKMVTLTNSGTGPLTINNITLVGTNAGDFNQSNTCPTGSGTLAVNASCTISVTFSPSASGSRSATITMTDNAGDNPQSVALTGSGVTATTYFSDGFESGNFNQWNLGSSDSTGSRTIQSSVVNSGSNAAQFTNGAGQYSYLYSSLSSAQALTYTRFSFRIASGTGGTQLLIGRNASGNNVLEVDYNANRHGLDIYVWNGARTLFSMYSAQNSIKIDTWYNLEVEMNEVTAGHAEAWLNGTSIGTVDNDLSMAQPYDRMMLFEESVGSIYFDDIVVSNSYNGPTGGLTSSVPNPQMGQTALVALLPGERLLNIRRARLL